ncbi:MAG: hypothetical protein ABUS79_04695, partial [Pseudomonadota bacterium]
MTLALLNPRWLWLLVICWPAVWIVALATRRQEGRAPWIAAVIRTALLTGLVIAAARPVRVSDVSAVSAVALLDVSASVSNGELQRAQRLIDALSRAAVSPHELRVVRFAAAPMEVRTNAGGGFSPAAATRPDGDGAFDTDIASALGLAAGLGDPARTRRVLLLSDGRATAGDALAQAAGLATLGIRVDTIALSADGDAADVAVDSLSVPGDVRPRAAFPLQVRLAADRPARVRVTLKRDGEPFGDPRVQTIATGDTTVTWDARIDAPGTAVFAATVERWGDPPASSAVSAAVSAAALATPDAHPENDRGLLAIATDAPPRVLVLAGAAPDAAPLVAALRAQAMDVTVHATGRPTNRAFDRAALARADLVALCDLPRAALDDDTLAALDAYVRDGGGLLVTGGPHAFGPGGWDGSRLEPLLPVRLDLPGQR